VDLDPAMTELGEHLPPLRALNQRSFEDPRLTIVNDDAMRWLATAPPGQQFDVVIIDFPDPNNFSLGKLYTTRFYRLLQRRLASGASVAVQSTSPLFARQSFWCIVQTLRSTGFSAHPYHANVPSFGEWGFVLAKQEAFEPPAQTPPGARYVDAEVMRALFVFPPDMQPVPVEDNRLDSQVLVRYYESEWKQWN